MIRYLRHNDIDKIKWDKAIASSPHGIVYAYSWYLDIASPGWEALVLDDYSGIFPLTCRKKAGFNYLYQPFFTQQLGVFSDEKNIPESVLKEFVAAIPEKFRLIEIQLNNENELSSADGFEIHQRLTHHLPLSSTIESIRNGYSENLRRNLKKAEKNSVEVEMNINPEEITDLFRQNRGEDIDNLKDSEYKTLLSLCASAAGRNLLECSGTRNASRNLTSGAIFLRSNRSYIFLFSATGEEAKNSGAMSLVIDSFIRDHAGEEIYLDFEGSMDTNLARYYKSFGSKEVVYLQIRKNNLPFLIRWLK